MAALQTCPHSTRRTAGFSPQARAYASDIISVDGQQRVYVRDLTPSGARISCVYRLRQDWDVVFKRGDLFLATRVVWTRKETAGLRFYRKIDPATVLGIC